MPSHFFLCYGAKMISRTAQRPSPIQENEPREKCWIASTNIGGSVTCAVKLEWCVSGRLGEPALPPREFKCKLFSFLQSDAP